MHLLILLYLLSLDYYILLANLLLPRSSEVKALFSFIITSIDLAPSVLKLFAATFKFFKVLLCFKELDRYLAPSDLMLFQATLLN